MSNIVTQHLWCWVTEVTFIVLARGAVTQLTIEGCRFEELRASLPAYKCYRITCGGPLRGLQINFNGSIKK